MSKVKWVACGIIALIAILFFGYWYYYQSLESPFAIVLKVDGEEVYLPRYWMRCDDQTCVLDRGLGKAPLDIKLRWENRWKVACAASIGETRINCSGRDVFYFPHPPAFRSYIVLSSQAELFSSSQQPRIWLETKLVPFYMGYNNIWVPFLKAVAVILAIGLGVVLWRMLEAKTRLRGEVSAVFALPIAVGAGYFIYYFLYSVAFWNIMID